MSFRVLRERMLNNHRRIALMEFVRKTPPNLFLLSRAAAACVVA